MNIAGFDIGVCSWSLQPKDMADLVAKVRELGLEHMQLDLASLVMLDDKRKHQELSHLRSAGIKLTAGMVHFPGEDYSSISMIRETGGFMPDGHWPARKQIMIQGGKLGRELGITMVSTHVGFVPASNDPRYEVAVARVRELAAAYQELGLSMLMETGQERASELLQFLNDLSVRNVGINFDPANMILYGAGDPIEAIEVLDRHIRHVHVKDGTLSSRPGVTWGEEVPFGSGHVPHAEFIEALRRINYRGPLVIEREAGNQRMDDVGFAIETLGRVLA